MSHRLRALIAVTIIGCVGEEHDFTLNFTFKGDVCGGLDLLSRQRVAKIEYQIFGPGDSTTPIQQASFLCTDQPISLALEPVRHRIVVTGIGDDGNRCWDTGPEGVPITPTEDGTLTIDVPQVCVLNDAVRLTIEVVGAGDVVSEPAGIDCPSVSCAAVYDRYAGVRLTAKPHNGAEFSHWTGCGEDQPEITVAMFSTRECTAIFADPHRSDWSAGHNVVGPDFTEEWSAAVEDNAPMVVFADGSDQIGLSRAPLLPDQASDWESIAILAGDLLAAPKIAVEANRTWITAAFARSDGCGVAVMSRGSSGDSFALSQELVLAAPPCEPESGGALVSLGGGALLLASVTDTAVVARLIEGGSVTSAEIFAAPSLRAVRGVSNMVLSDGRPALAFAVFDRELEQGQIWIALARTTRPVLREDWNIHPLFTTGLVPETPALIVDGTHFALTFATIDGLGRDTERRSQHLAMSVNTDPRSPDDWTLVAVDHLRGGQASLVKHNGQLAIAYGHFEATTGISSVVVASSIEAQPIGPQSFSVHELDQTVLPTRPQLLTIGTALGIFYRQDGDNPLVFRSTESP